MKSKFQKTSKGNLRQWKNVGLGFKTPKSAIDNNYVDKKCPWTGNVSIRGRIIRGVVRSVKMSRTLVVRRDYLHWVTKYQRYEKRHQNFAAHVSPAFVGQRVCTLPYVFSSHAYFQIIFFHRSETRLCADSAALCPRLCVSTC